GGAFQKIDEFSTDNTPGGVGSTARINDHLVYDLHNPLGAKTVQVKWGYEQTGNDWWWAIDNVKLTGDKTDPAQETIQIQSQPAHGSVSVDSNGAVVYTPSPSNYTGPDSFTYKLFDGQATSNTATVNLTVNANNTAPVATIDSFSTIQATPIKIQFDQ